MKIILLLLVLICFPAIAEAGTDLRVDLFNPTTILEDIDEMSATIITTIRVGTLIILALLVVSIGMTLFTAKDSYALEQVKTRIIFVFVGLLLVFTTEPIVNFIYSIVR